MTSLENLLQNNIAWSTSKIEQYPEFFSRLSKQQKPEFLWIGCADSRVPANEIVGLAPGELFVHRNIANVVVHTDLNCLSVLHFAVDILKVKHIIVCGHYGCSGVASVVTRQSSGISEHWLRHVEDIATKYAATLEPISEDSKQIDRLCELNVIEQVRNVCRTTTVREAWKRGQAVSVHGLIYSLSDGVLRDLNITISGKEQMLKMPEGRHRVLSAHGGSFSPQHFDCLCSETELDSRKPGVCRAS